MFIDTLMGRKNWNVYIEYYLPIKESHLEICDSIKKTEEHYTKLNKPYLERQTL